MHYSISNAFLEGAANVKTELISYETRELLQLINFVLINGPLCVFGILANSINMIVFTKQGFKDSMNISLLGLATADLACMVTGLWTSICFNPLFSDSWLPFNQLDVMYLTGGYSHECFSRSTSFITAFITLERCLCITTPLKVKTIITPKRTKIIITSIFVVMIILFSPFYFVNNLGWRFSPEVNKTIFALIHGNHRELVEAVTFGIHSVALSGLVMATVIICTVILVVKLNKKSKWRMKATAQAVSKTEPDSVKEKKVVKMVTLISIIFIICFLPPTLIFFMMAYEPEFSSFGAYKNMLYSTWSIAYALETINSSVNIFVYYNMSLKYRQTFQELFVAK